MVEVIDERMGKLSLLLRNKLESFSILNMLNSSNLLQVSQSYNTQVAYMLDLQLLGLG